MPEIYMFFFDLGALLKLFPKKDNEILKKLNEYEKQTEFNMADNRIKLFGGV
ncbi:hypothetical protein IJ579_01415 [bacterium]|nr:hypothetical protein [bacterium]